MRVDGLGWLGVRTDRFEETVSLYRDLLALDPFHVDETSVRFRLGDGTELHVYGPADADHEFFGTAPVVGLVVDDVQAVRRRMEAAGIEFVTPVEHAGASAWCHFRGPDGNVYEIISLGEA
jgi:catechol 2,3-dioxygenase-like lactoylglutathione lyase family enzyme